jgi:hypothetical protein
MHAIHGYPGKQWVKATAIHLGVKLTGTSQKCEKCAIGKDKKKNVPQLNPKKATKKEGHLSLDITFIKEKTLEDQSFGSSCKTSSRIIVGVIS